MLNQIAVMGRLVHSPELKKTSSGISVVSFTLAVDRDFKGADGTKETDFIDVVAWRGTADFVAKYLSKGNMAVAVGSLQSRKWQDRNGNNRTSWEIQASSVYFGEAKQSDSAVKRGVDVSAEDYEDGKIGGFQEIKEDGELPF